METAEAVEMEVITMETAEAVEMEVITMETAEAVEMEVITMGTAEAMETVEIMETVEAMEIMEVAILMTANLIAMILNPDLTEAKSFRFLEIHALFLMITIKIVKFILVVAQFLKLSINQALQLEIKFIGKDQTDLESLINTMLIMLYVIDLSKYGLCFIFYPV